MIMKNKFRHVASLLGLLIFLVLAVGSIDTDTNQSLESNSSSGGEHQILKDNIGCTDKEYFYKMVGYAVEKDYEAFEKAFAMGTLAGICTTFKKGETVYLTDVAMFKGLIKLRRKGEVEEYWTNTHVID